MTEFPTRPDAMSADWLAVALGRPAGALRGFTASAVGTGQMCDSFRLVLDWADRGDAPASVVAKCPSLDPASRDIALRLGNYALEVNWYRALAGRVPVPRPHCHFAAIVEEGEAAGVDFLLLLEDMAPARQGDQLAGADGAMLDAAIDAAAALHAALWNSAELEAISWLHKDNRPLVRALFPGMFAAFRERYAGRLDAECLDLGAGIVAHLDAYLDRVPHARTLTHGDMRIDNILFSPGDRDCWIVDWQTVGIGSGATDLAYLIGTSIADPAARALADERGFARWVAALEARGVAADRAALWDDYRVGALSGYFMAVFASMSVERTARGDEMFAVMAERPARQALALGSLGVLRA
jgi:aminoglycoside phosphotransferase (APT) family kinase protein